MNNNITSNEKDIIENLHEEVENFINLIILDAEEKLDGLGISESMLLTIDISGKKDSDLVNYVCLDTGLIYVTLGKYYGVVIDMPDRYQQDYSIIKLSYMGFDVFLSIFGNLFIKFKNYYVIVLDRYIIFNILKNAFLIDRIFSNKVDLSSDKLPVLTVDLSMLPIDFGNDSKEEIFSDLCIKIDGKEI